MIKTISIAWTGASGGAYGIELVRALLANDIHVHLMISDAARIVLATENQLDLPSNVDKCRAKLLELYQPKNPELLDVWSKQNWFSPVASGSSAPKTMVICPCSTGSLASIAHGMSDGLIDRAADVVLKERGKLIMVVRETPLSQLHLENMLKLTQMGAVIMPAAPGFYKQPSQIEDLINFMVARILDHLGIPQTIMQPWGYKNND
jgi:flavin prenyltransferase